MEDNKQEGGFAETELSLESLAQQALNRKLSVPAIFFLEMYKPLSTVLHSMTLVSAPILGAIFGTRQINSILQLLNSRPAIEQLIQLIEEKQKAQDL